MSVSNSLCPSNTVAVTRNHTEVEEDVDLVEENLRAHIEQEKKTWVFFPPRSRLDWLVIAEAWFCGLKFYLLLPICPVSYKSIIGRLKAIRTEIEHLQLLLERAKVKLQKDFHKWWNQEASSLQVTALPVWEHHPWHDCDRSLSQIMFLTWHEGVSVHLFFLLSSEHRALRTCECVSWYVSLHQCDPHGLCSTSSWMGPSGKICRRQIHKNTFFYRMPWDANEGLESSLEAKQQPHHYIVSVLTKTTCSGGSTATQWGIRSESG